MPRYDAAIIGGGPEGLVAAATLARAGCSVVVLERKSQAGGRAATLAFHPGFRASPYADELPAISSRLYRGLNLARHGAVLIPTPASACLSDEGVSTLFSDDARMARSAPPDARDGLLALRGDLARLSRSIELRARTPAAPKRRFRIPFRKRRAVLEPWPGEEWARESLDEMLRSRLSDSALRLHLAADAVSGRAVSPFLAGTALHLLAPGSGRSGTASGGLASLGAALAAAARAAGAVIRCNAVVKDIALKRGRAVGLVLGSGEEIDARVVLSALDLKHTFLDLLAANGRSADYEKRLRQFRIAGQTARVLFALDAPPAFAFAGDCPDAARGAIHVAASLKALNRSYNSWRSGALDEMPPVCLRVPSLADPRLAPVGKAVMTVTVSAVPGRLFDGAWTAAKREKLRDLALAAAERAAPGVSARVIASHTIVGPDIETELGVTAGDLDGGEIALDQVFPFHLPGEGNASEAEWEAGRTPVSGLYAVGSCVAPAPFLSGAAGERTARAILADFGARRT